MITQYFLLEVQAGHSLGLAALKAQQRYVEQVDELDPIDLKTLAQFYLLGDPSVQPVKIDSATRTPPAAAEVVAKRSMRAARRANTERIGHALRETKPTASQPVEPTRSPAVRRQLSQIARQIGCTGRVIHGVRGAVRRPVGRRQACNARAAWTLQTSITC